LDTQLREQGFGLMKVGKFETLIGSMRRSEGCFSQNFIEDSEWYLAPFYVVGLKERDYDETKEEEKGYALYVRCKQNR